MGRGLLNGLGVYTDLFESKPPGIFVLAALSLIITGDERFLLCLQIALLAAMPVAAAWYAAQATRGKHWHDRLLFCGTGFAIAAFLAFYILERSEPVQTEAIGSVFACGFILSVSAWQGSYKKKSAVLSALLLLATAGMKEPFLLTSLAGALLLTTRRRELVWTAAVVGLATFSGILFVAALGALPEYFTIYLPAMLEGRVGGLSAEPLWVRGFAVAKVLFNLGADNPSNPLLGPLIASLWILYPTFQGGTQGVRPRLLAATAVVTAYFAMVWTWRLLVLGFLIKSHGVSFNDPTFWSVLSATGGLWALFFGFWWLTRDVTLRRALIAVPLAWYLTSLAIGLADYRPTHFSVGVPVYFALLLVFIRHGATEQRHRGIAISLSALVFISSLRYSPDLLLQQLRDAQRFSFQSEQHNVEQLERVLEDCNSPEYYALGGFTSVGFTEQSPIGPLFLFRDHVYLGAEHELVAATFRRVDEQARILVLPADSVLPPAFEYLRGSFTADAPECARQAMSGTGLMLWFRQE